MAVKLIWEENGIQEDLIIFSDIDILVFKNDLPGDQGIKDWFRLGPASQKVKSCRKRLIKGWQSKLLNDPHLDSIPTDEDALIKLIIDHPDYRDRQQRDDLKKLRKETFTYGHSEIY